MDPISQISTILGIVVAIPYLISSCQKTAASYGDLINGPALAQDLVSDVYHFRCLLEAFQRYLQDERIVNRIPQDWFNRVLEETRETIKELEVCLKSAGADDENHVPVRRWSWLRVEEKCRGLRRRLGNHFEKLNELMRIAQFEWYDLIYANCLRDPQFLALCAAGTGKLTQQETVVELELATGEHELRTLSTSSTLGKVSRSDPIAALGSCLDTVALLRTQEEKDQTGIAIEASDTAAVLRIRKNNCRCECHSRVQNRLLVFPHRCDNFECCARKSRSRKFLAISPRWLQNIVKISIVARGQNFNNSPKTRKQIREGSEANTYAKTGNVEGLKRLIENGLATPCDTTSDNWTLLHAAAYYGQLLMVQYLLEQRADIDASENGERTPADLARVRALMLSSTELQKTIANMFKNAEEFKIDAGLTPIHVALLGLYDHDDKAQPPLIALLRFAEEVENAQGVADWKKWRLATLQKFAKEREDASAEADWNMWGLPDHKQSPLFREIIAQHRIPGEPRLIDRKDGKWGWTPFMWAAYTGRRAEMETLITRGADPFKLSKMGRNALHLAAESKMSEALAYVLAIPTDQENLDINLPDQWKETPLHVAASRSAACVKLLLEKGANRDARQENQQVPLHYVPTALGEERYEIIKLLSDANDKPTKADDGPIKADDEPTKVDDEPAKVGDEPIKAQDKDGKSPMHQLESINALDEEGKSPIFLLTDSPDCVRVLVKRGADISLLDGDARSVFHHACNDNHGESLKVLIENSTDQPGLWSDLMSLAWNRSPSCARVLIEKNAFGDLNGKEGLSLVHRAAMWGSPEVLEAALKHPTFEWRSKTTLGDTATDIARATGNFKGRCKDLLLKYDSKGMRPPGYVKPPASGGGPTTSGEATAFYLTTR